MPDRRQVLGWLAGGIAMLLAPGVARAGDGSFDVSYLWVPELDGALDYRAQLSELLGPQVARDLQIVKGGSGNYGVLYDRSGRDRSAAEGVARAHDRILRSALGGREVRAIAISDSGYQRLFHVGYGLDAELAQAKSRFARVAQVLGDGVRRHLFIERTSAGYRTVYQRFGTLGDTRIVGEKHRALLDRYGIDVEPAQETLADVVWSASSRGTLPPPMGSEVSAVAAPGEPAATEPSAMEPAAREVEPASPEPTATEPEVKPMEPAASEPEVEPSEPVVTEPEPMVTEPREPELAGPASAPKTGFVATARLALPTTLKSPLRNSINEHVQKLRRSGRLSSDERSAWYVLNLRDDKPLAAINAELPLQCASMVKPFVALGILHQAKAGRILYGPVTTAKMEAMIQRSDNGATNWLIDKLGGPTTLHRLLQKHYAALFGTLSIVESIPAYGRTYRNRAAALDYVRLLRAMWHDELPNSGELKRLLNLPGRDRLFTGAPSIPVGTQVFNKTGSTSHLCGDMGILVSRTVRGEELPYVVVALIEKRSRAGSYGRWITSRANVIRGVSNLVYQHLKRSYGLV